MKPPVGRALRATLALSLIAIADSPLRAAAPAPAPLVSDVPVPGGLAGLFRAADLPAPSEPATALLGIVRALHAPGAKPNDRVTRYLDTMVRVQAAVNALPRHEVTGGPSATPVTPQVAAWANACGVSIDQGRFAPAPGPEAASRRQALETNGVPLADWLERLNEGGTLRVELASDVVPLPLTPDLWNTCVLRRRVSREDVARAILGDPVAASLYYGLMGLDDETLTYLGAHAALLTAIAQHGAGAFAEHGAAIRVSGGRIVLPGGDRTASMWQAVVGHQPGDVDGFIRSLLARDEGRAAFFYDTVAHLDPAHQAFALGSTLGPDQVSRFRALYAGFARTRTVESVGGRPIVRHPISPATILREVKVDAKGELAAPSDRALWDAALAGNPAGCPQAATERRPADAAWLVDRLEREFLEKRAERLGAITFAQRVFAHAQPQDLHEVCEAAASFPRYQALDLTLERMGFDRPDDYVRAIQFADRLWAGADRWAAVVRTAQAEGIFVILARAAEAGTISKAAARDLTASLLALATGPGGAKPDAAGKAEAPAPGALALWMSKTLLPAFGRRQESADACVIRNVSGVGVQGDSPREVLWEEQRYRVDLGAATAVRIAGVRRRQRANDLESVLTLVAAAAALADGRAGPDVVERQGAILKATVPGLVLDLPELFGHPLVSLQAEVVSAAARMAGTTDARERGQAAASLLRVGDVLFAHALVSFAYAAAIGDPDDAALMSGDPARRHLFDGLVGPALDAWHLPEEVQMVDRSWVIEGALMGLRAVYARSWIRRLSIQDPGARPRPDPQDVQTFGETAAAFSPFPLTDVGRDALAGAIRRGRERVAALVGDPGHLWDEAARVGLSPWRCRAALWLAPVRPERARALFSLSDMLWLGDPQLPDATLDAWGVSVRPIDTSLAVRMPRARPWEVLQGPRGVGLLATQFAEVHLRVAEALHDLNLPATLAPGVASYAVWDVMTSSDMAHPDDRFALARAAQALPQDRIVDYVSALTAIGPLVPVQ